MAATALRLIAKRVAKYVAGYAAGKVIQTAVTGDRSTLTEDLEALEQGAENLLGRNPAEVNRDDLQEALRRGAEDGTISISRMRRVEEHVAADFNDFMSVGLEKCLDEGASTQERKEQFSRLTEVWNREKEDIRKLSPAQIRQRLDCP